MEIKKSPTTVPPRLPEINLGQTEKSSSDPKSTGVAATKDSFEASNLKLTDSLFAKDSRSRYEESKNSGLPNPFGIKNNDAKFDLNNADFKDTSGRNPEKTSEAVKDGQRIIDGVSVRDALNEEVAKRNEERNAVGGRSNSDRLQNLMDPAARGENQNTPPKGKETVGVLIDRAEENKFLPNDKTDKANDVEVKNLEFDNRTETQIFVDGKKVLTEMNFKGDTSDNFINDLNRALSGKDTPKSSNGSVKLVDQENYTGNIPSRIKDDLEFLKKQQQTRQSGGELIQVDPNAEPVVRVDDQRTIHLTQTGINGMVGQPNRTGEDVGDPSRFDGGTNPDVNGGYSDPTDGNYWSGRTIKDDPADVQFGPATAPKEQTKNNKEDESSKLSLLDELSLRRQARIR